MNFFSALFGHKKKSQHTPAPQSQNKAQKGADRQLYFQLLDAVVPSASIRNKLKHDMIKAFEEPASFYDESGEYKLAMRGLRLSRDVKTTPKFVFIDRLIEKKLMAEVDWKEEEEEVRRWIIAIMNAKGFSAVVSEEVKYENEYTTDAIELINTNELMPHNYSLQILDIQSDCYVFTIVRVEDAEKIKQMFAEL